MQLERYVDESIETICPSALLNRRDDETYIAYCKRMVELKKQKKLSYDQFGDLIFEDANNYSSENIRKFYYMFQIFLDKCDDDAVSNEKDLIIALEEKRAEIQKERYKIQAAKLELQRATRQEARFELFYDNIKDTIIRLPVPEFKPLLPSHFDENKCEDKEWILGFGDFHYGATFESKNNSYSREICAQRLEYLLNSLVPIINKNNIRNLKIINVADTIQGILRMTDLQINDIPVVESVVEISRLLATFLNNLSRHCKVEYYHCPCANHSQTRPLGSKASEIATEDMEKIIGNYIYDLLSDNSRVNVVIDLDSDYLSFKIFDFNAIVLHGHQIKSVEGTIKDLSNLHRTFYDYAFLGHRHSANEIIVGEGKNHNIEILTCPSFVGSDPYSDKLMVGSKAMAKLYEFDANHGHISSHNIILN